MFSFVILWDIIFCDPEATHQTRVSQEHREEQEDAGVSDSQQERSQGQARVEEEAVPPAGAVCASAARHAHLGESQGGGGGGGRGGGERRNKRQWRMRRVRLLSILLEYLDLAL